MPLGLAGGVTQALAPGVVEFPLVAKNFDECKLIDFASACILIFFIIQ